jgi:adenylate cyclase
MENRRRHNGRMTVPADDRRLVTVLFADLVGFTGRAEAEDAESMREIQRAYFAAVTAEVERYGGRVEKYIGDAVMVLFGVPQAHDDDAERALHASLHVRDAVRGLGFGLEIRIGVNTGEVVGGPGSGPSADDYTVTGDAVNVAARLQQAAAPGEILVGLVTSRLAGEEFELESLPGALDLKGKSQAVEALRLVGGRPQRLRLRGGRGPLVGRARELASVDAALAEAEAGRGLLVAIVGEAGIGKSRLALEVQRHAEERGFAAVWATARSYSDAFPYHLLAQLVEGLLVRGDGEDVGDALAARGVATDAGTMEHWVGLLREILGEISDDPGLRGLTPAARQQALVMAIGRLLSSRAADGPLVVVLDDLQWTDAASLAVLDEVVDMVPELPMLAIALHRSGWAHGWAQKPFYEQVTLRALRPDHTLELARELLTGVTSANPSQEVLDRSGGNPFFLEELLKTATGGGGYGEPGRRLPETVHEVVLARIDALPADARQLLREASVVGVEFTEPMLRAVDPDADLQPALRTLQRQDLIVVRSRDPEPLFAFRHQLIHEVAYRSLLLARRRELHQRIASWLEARDGDESLAAIASHYRDSDDVKKARAYLPRAAERAANLYAAHEAMRFYQEAAQLFTDDAATRARMLERAATQAYLVEDVDQAIALIGTAIENYDIAGETLRALDCRRVLGRFYWLIGRGKESEAEIERAIEGLEKLPPSPELALAYSFRAQVRMLMPDFAEGEAWARKAIEMAKQTNATPALVHAYNNLGFSMLGLGEAKGLDYLRRSLDLAVENALPDDAVRAYINMAGQGCQISLLPYAEQAALLGEGIDFAQRMIPGGTWYLWLQSALGEFLFHTGRWDDAERVLASSQHARALRYVVVSAATIHALIAAHRGDYERAARLMRPEVDAAIRIGDLLAVAPVFTALAHIDAGLGNGQQAVDAVRRLIQARGDRSEATISTWLAFEATDVVSGLALTDDGAATQGVAAVIAFVDGLGSDIARGGPPAELAVRRALFGAAREQLVRLARRTGATEPMVNVDPSTSPGSHDAIAHLDEARRLFDAARVRLWLAESGDSSRSAAAVTAFEQLQAAPYLARARQPSPPA